MKSSVGKSIFEYPLNEILNDKVFENIIVKNWQIHNAIKRRYLRLRDEIVQMITIVENETED